MQGIAVSEPLCSPAAGRQWTLPFPRGDWEETPDSVRLNVLTLLREKDLFAASVTALTTQVAQVEEALTTAQARSRKNSKNSSRPPSSDNPSDENPPRHPLTASIRRPVELLLCRTSQRRNRSRPPPQRRKAI